MYHYISYIPVTPLHVIVLLIAYMRCFVVHTMRDYLLYFYVLVTVVPLLTIKYYNFHAEHLPLTPHGYVICLVSNNL